MATGTRFTRRHVVLLDEEVRWVRHPRDLVAAILSLTAIAFVMFLAVYGAATTLAVTRDVRTATSDILETILFIPVNVLEGLLSFVLPVMVAIDLIWHRRWRSLVTAIAAAGSAVAISYAVLWLFQSYFPLSPITGQLLDSLDEQSYISLLPYVSVISAFLTVAGSGKRTKTTSWGWPLLYVALVISVLQGNQTLPGALITILLGTFCGQLARYLSGDTPDRSTGIALVNLVRRAGIDATQIARIDDIPDISDLRVWRVSAESPLGYVDRYGLSQLHSILERAGQNLSKKAGADGTDSENGADPADEATATDPAPVQLQATDEYVLQPDGSVSVLPLAGNAPTADELQTLQDDNSGPATLTLDPDADPQELRSQLLAQYHPPTNSNASRSYLAIDADGRAYQLTFLDADQHIMGVLNSLWNRIVLTTSTRRSERTLEASANQLALMELAATDAGVCPNRHLRIAASDQSVIASSELADATVLADVVPEEVPDAALDSLWVLLQEAHSRGISHGDIHAKTVILGEDALQLVHWQSGSIAANEVARRVDMAQALAMMAVHVGSERALASARRCLPLDQLVTIAPILQKAILPHETGSALASRKELQTLRDSLVETVPEVGDVEPMQLQRFSPRTIITVVIAVVAIYLLLGSINFEELRETVSQAVPGWMVFSFVVGLFTYVGAAITLKAYTAEELPLRQTTIVQVAASIVALVAPAGIGPAAFNLRYLQKRQVPVPVGVATVTLVQVAQFVTTVLLLLLLGLATGNLASFQVPTGTVMLVFGALVLLVLLVFVIKPLRRWIISKAKPTIDQIWPRLVWLGTHPTRIMWGLLGSVIQSAAFVAAFGGALAAFGQTLPVVTLAITYLVSNSVGAVVPSPGGIGPVEAALTGGLTLAGIPASVALSTAILFRLVTFWIRIPLGWFALRHSQKKNIV